ncbi:hypothetical protein [Phycicoccus sp.]|uniref:hypothetical protein n=1 Tax=Phycicoccus sp. TaxID=1902410 RepID=UPI002CB5EA89|nr:hypothetical protein [Phycicoccus sp.]HMM95347.1 hypothetical protein [Phycicoccus sp.]
MATTYTGRKAVVRRVPTPPILRRNPLSQSELSWRASIPGRVYLVGDGLHFDQWDGAISYVTDPEAWPREDQP